LVVVGLLFGGAYDLAHADYVHIKIDISLLQEAGQNQGQQSAGRGGLGMPNMPGAGMGRPGGGGPGMGGPGMGGPGMGGPGMGGPGMGGPGGGNSRPGGGNPRGGGSGPGTGGNLDEPGADGRGGNSQGPRPGPGMPNMPGGRGPGGMGMPNMPGGFGGNQQNEAPPPKYIEAVVEIRARRTLERGIGQQSPVQIDTKWGTTTLYKDPPNRPVRGATYEFIRPKVSTVWERYQARLKDIPKTNATEKQLEDIAEWTLRHGLLTEFTKHMDELVNTAPKNPAAIAYKQVTEAMHRPITRRESSTVQQTFGRFTREPSKEGHYVLYYDGRTATTRPEIQSRLRRLENNYRAFYYWFALRGKVLQPPDYPLVAVMLQKKDDFRLWEKAFNPSDPAAEGGEHRVDGFLARRENLAVFSMEPLEDIYEQFVKTINDKMKEGWDFDLLLQRKPRTRAYPKTPPPSWDDVDYMKTVALVIKVHQEESEIATVTHEGTRQLLAASSLEPGKVLLPRAVDAPRWLQFGMGSFFETPKGAYWMGTGAPSWTYLKEFKTRKDKLDPAETALKKVIRDTYFKDAADASRATATADSKVYEDDLLKARTMSWALTYYLATEQLDGLLKYFDELNNLPRDLEFEPDVLEGCFARAFGLGQANDASKLDSTKASDFANKWYDKIQFTLLEVEEIKNQLQTRERSKRGGSGYTPPGQKGGEDSKPKPPGGK
jgi:hypothetical protein